MSLSLSGDGVCRFAATPASLEWAQAAGRVVAGMDLQPRRHGGTWFVGVDALPNTPDGAIDGVPLAGAWQGAVVAPATWHAAQLSVVFAGYPGRDADESEAAHRFRRNRDAAHVDGLLPEGPDRRRHLREPHGFILGLPINAVAASPLVVWRGSHVIMQAAFAAAFAGHDPARWGDIDVTDAYQAARRQVFDTCERMTLEAATGEAVLLHRHILHGVAPWSGPAISTGRQIAYFRPIIAAADWI